jgi:integration host factor subunit alpha
MSITKKNIIKNLSKETAISIADATILLESFLLLVKKHAKTNKVKLSSFGSFCFKKTPKRIGRNPKTSDSYIIPELNKLNFKPSNILKDKIN